jgi:hypothetical protein
MRRKLFSAVFVLALALGCDNADQEAEDPCVGATELATRTVLSGASCEPYREQALHGGGDGSASLTAWEICAGLADALACAKSEAECEREFDGTAGSLELALETQLGCLENR